VLDGVRARVRLTLDSNRCSIGSGKHWLLTIELCSSAERVLSLARA